VVCSQIFLHYHSREPSMESSRNSIQRCVIIAHRISVSLRLFFPGRMNFLPLVDWIPPQFLPLLPLCPPETTTKGGTIGLFSVALSCSVSQRLFKDLKPPPFISPLTMKGSERPLSGFFCLSGSSQSRKLQSVLLFRDAFSLFFPTVGGEDSLTH